MINGIIRLIRPQQWMKNGFVFLPLFFNGQFSNLALLWKCVVAFIAYSFAASSIYCFNDIWDVEADRLHPKKCKRPIASGTVPKVVGYVMMGVMLVGSLTVTYIFSNEQWPKVAGLLLFYYVMNLIYCTWLKQKMLIDVFIIAVGFVLRVILGGIVTDIVLSQWIIIMTFLLALFLAFAKRRDDVVVYAETGVKPRKNINRYNLDFMNQSITIIAAVTLVAYVMYTVSPEVTDRIGNPYLYATSLFVLLGILRYMQLAIVDVKSGSPTKVLIKDHFIQLCVVGWIASFCIILYY